MMREKPGLGPNPHGCRDHSSAETQRRADASPARRPLDLERVCGGGAQSPSELSSQCVPRAPRIHRSIIHPFVQLISNRFLFLS